MKFSFALVALLMTTTQAVQINNEASIVKDCPAPLVISEATLNNELILFSKTFKGVHYRNAIDLYTELKK